MLALANLQQPSHTFPSIIDEFVASLHLWPVGPTFDKTINACKCLTFA